MATNVAPEVRRQLESNGAAISGDIGGLKKKRYWTPDGREIMAVPAMRDFMRKKDGKVIESGTRDANYDKGWLDHQPNETEIKLRCIYCDKWHDTEEEIKACAKKKKKFDEKYMKLAKKDAEKDNSDYEERLAKLEEKVEGSLSRIEEMLAKVLKE